ncbi:MAG TPA: DUF2269 family protein [Gaiellaceae bacterium]|jgi:uncharacterized membrane protein|nr:DUF2269 family protein [Gaiellaceae bacterium]
METTSSTTPAARGTSARVTIGVGLAVVFFAALFAFNSAWYGHWYALFRVIHIVLAVFWVGGGLMLTILGLRAERSTDPMEMATLARQAAFAGEKFFAPAGVLVLLMGIAMMINTNWGWGKFWVIAGLIGYAATFVTGIGFLSPLAKKVDELLTEKGPAAPETQAAIQRILLVARVDIGVLLLVVADMVTKPFS